MIFSLKSEQDDVLHKQFINMLCLFVNTDDLFSGENCRNCFVLILSLERLLTKSLCNVFLY